MGMLVVMGAGLKCSFGQGGPLPLVVAEAGAMVGGLPVATVADAEPIPQLC